MKKEEIKVDLKVRVAQEYLEDESTENHDTSEIATVCQVPTDDEELVMIQYEGGSIDYVPQNIIEIAEEKTYIVSAETTSYCSLEVKAMSIEEAHRIAEDADGGDFTPDNDGGGEFNIQYLSTVEKTSE